LALIQLKSASKCEFDLPEALFDMDYPGHFKRRIKSVSVSIPCIAGPYTGVNATLRLLSNKFRNSSISNSYPEKIDGSEERFISYNIPVTAIATSSGQNDAGVFELNFKDERYLPFEGAGAISRWSLELPSIKQFNYNTIADVILHVKFTASEGGEQLKTAAISSVISQLNNQEGLVALIDLKHDMPNEWNVLLKKGSTNIKINKSSLSYLAQGQNAVIAEVMFIAKLKSQPPSFEIGVETALPHVAGAIIPTTLLSRVEEWKLYRGSNSDILLDAVFNLSVPSQVNNLEELVMVVIYGI
jgi:Tc toxin complex TcA C-terminal TcB-binding domain